MMIFRDKENSKIVGENNFHAGNFSLIIDFKVPECVSEEMWKISVGKVNEK